jgi:hypothetical protein
MPKTTNNTSSTNALSNGADLNDAILNLQNQTTGLSSSVTAINTAIASDDIELATLTNQLNGLVSATGSNSFTGTNSFSVLPTSSTVPSSGPDLTNKTYVDSQINTRAKLTGSNTFTVLPQCSATPSNNTDLTNKLYVDTRDALNVKLAGANTLTVLPTCSSVPTVDTDLTNKLYVDTQDTLNAKLAGTNTFTGSNNTFSNIAINDRIVANSTNYNLFMGFGPSNISTGANNTGVGRLTMGSLTTGSNNVAIGYNSLNFLTTGNRNVGCGYTAGVGLSTGSNNTFIGHGTNVATSALSYCTAVGSDVICDASNQIKIGRNTDSVVVAGNLSVLGNITIGDATTDVFNVLASSTIGQQYNTTTNILGAVNIGSVDSGISMVGQLNLMKVPTLDSTLNNTNITSNNHVTNKQYVDKKTDSTANLSIATLTTSGNVTIGDNSADVLTVNASSNIGQQYNTTTNVLGTVNLGSVDSGVTMIAQSNFMKVPTLDSTLNNTNITSNNHLANKQYVDKKTDSTANLSIATLATSGNVTIGDSSADVLTVNASSNIGTQYNTTTNILGTVNLGSVDSGVTMIAQSNFMKVPTLDSSLNDTNITSNNHVVSKQYVDNAITLSKNAQSIKLSLVTTTIVDSGNASNKIIVPPFLGSFNTTNSYSTNSTATVYDVFLNIPDNITNSAVFEITYSYSTAYSIGTPSIPLANSFTITPVTNNTSQNFYGKYSLHIVPPNLQTFTLVSVNNPITTLAETTLTNDIGGNPPYWGGRFNPATITYVNANKVKFSIQIPNVLNTVSKWYWIPTLICTINLCNSTSTTNGFNTSTDAYFSLT